MRERRGGDLDGVCAEVVYYESMKRKLKIKPLYECRCDGRLQTKRFTHLSYTEFVVELDKDEVNKREKPRIS